MSSYIQHNPKGLFASEALYLIGKSYAAIDSLDKAIATLERNGELFTEEEFGKLSFFEIGNIYYQIESYDKAKLYYTHFIYFNSDQTIKDKAFLKIEKCNYYLGLYKSPIDIYEQFIKKYPLSPLVPELKVELANYYFSVQNYTEAIQEYKNIIEDFSECTWLDSVYFNLSKAYIKIGEWDMSAQTIHQLITRHPQSTHIPDAYRMLIDGFVSEKKFLSAIDTLNAIIEKTPVEKRNTYYEILTHIYEELGLNQELVYIYQIMIQQETDAEKAALLRLKLETIKKRTGKDEDSLKVINHELKR